jgi:preprotein translocase subunit SecD
VAPPRKSGSRPGRALALLAAVIVLMLIGIVGSNIGSPGKWHKDFKVGLGLDLSSGTQATLRAVTQKGATPPQADMKTAVAIINERVNASGNTGVSVQQEGSSDIQVTAPGQGSQQLINNVDTTAQLRFRPVLLEGSSTATATPSASATATPSASPSASGSSSAKAKAKAGATPSASTKAFIRPAAATPSPSAGATSSAKASSSASPGASASASPSATSSAAATTAGNPSAVNAATMKLFQKLDCNNLATWKTKLKYSEPQWDKASSQTVACSQSQPGVKYVLGPAVILGTDVTGESAGIDTTSNQPIVNLTLNGKATQAFRTLTATQATKYQPNISTNANDSVLDETAIVLDGNVVSAPQTTEAIPNGQVQITGLGSQAAATQLAQQLKFGALPLTFKVADTITISPTLGKSQLDTGLIAGGIGLILVVIYSFLYYRGLGSVSVSSLIIASLLGYLAVVLLSRYQSFTLSLPGIAGLIVAIGITADSFVVFFERLRDEVREGRSLRAAVESGWKRARRTILVSDTVSFLAALLLYIFSVGDV